MSESSNINNSLYEFELALVNTKSGSKTYLPINKGAIDYLEVEDSLAFFGYSGVVKIRNFFGILQQLNVLDTDNINCMYIGIRNVDLKKSVKEEPDSRMAFLALLDQGSESSVNNIEKTLNFRFEEYFVARLKHESIFQIGDKKNLTDTPGKLIHELLTISNKESVNKITNNTNQKNLFFNLVDEVQSTISLSNFYKPGSTSLYNIIVELYKYLSFTGTKKGPGILAASNIFKDNVIQRKFTLRSMSEYIQGFYLKYKQGSVDLSDYVTDEFTIGSSVSNNSLITNFIDTYDFLNVDQDDVLSNKWVDYIIAEAGADLANINTPSVLYDKVRHDFAIDMLAGLAPNLPDAPTNGTMNRRIIQKGINDSSGSLTQVSLENALKKSFIFDNKALNFTVPGNIYRKAGKFIKINDIGEPNTLKSEKRRNIDGYWFVISVKHIFRGDYYTNEYLCVKLHRGDNKLLEPQRASTASNNPLISLLQNTPLNNLFRNNPTGTSTTAVPDNNGILNPPLDGKAPPNLGRTGSANTTTPINTKQTTSEVFDTTAPLPTGITIDMPQVNTSKVNPNLPPPEGFK
jgi:hypothetical protein